MKILVYGGCHAGAIKKILDGFSQKDISVDILVNYTLIASGKPFPYELIKNYDFIIFNPILNKGDYNTVFLEEFCKSNAIRVIKYPWLQWGGYFPNPKKKQWGDKAEWGLSYLTELSKKIILENANRSVDFQFDSFYESLFNSKYFSFMESEVEKTTNILRKREEAGQVDFKISDFILKNYQKRQLFLTPDHGANFLYVFVIKQICDGLGIPVKIGNGMESEIQEGIRIPILPGVQEALGLKFQNHEYYNKEIFRNGRMSLRDFAMTYFEPLRVRMMVAINNTTIKNQNLKAIGTVGRGKRFLVRMGEHDQDGYMTVKILNNPIESLNTLVSVEPLDENVYIYKSHWSMKRADF